MLRLGKRVLICGSLEIPLVGSELSTGDLVDLLQLVTYPVDGVLMTCTYVRVLL